MTGSRASTPEEDGGAVAATARRGRPRSADRDQVIMDATIAILGEQGFEGLRVQDVADRAGVGLATIYRRWPTKEDLVRSVVLAHHKPDFPPTGDLAADLRTYLAFMRDELNTRQELLAVFLAAIRSESELAVLVREQAVDDLRATLRGMLRAGGMSAREARLRADIGPGLIFFRVVLAADTLGDAELDALVDLLVRRTG